MNVRTGAADANTAGGGSDGPEDGPIVIETGGPAPEEQDDSIKSALEFLPGPGVLMNVGRFLVGFGKDLVNQSEDNSTYTPPNTTTVIDGNRTFTMNNDTGVSTTATTYGDDSVVVTTSTPDVPGAANGPRTNETIVFGPNGEIFRETTVTSPTGGTYRPRPLDVGVRDTHESDGSQEGEDRLGVGGAGLGSARAPSGSGMGPDGATGGAGTGRNGRNGSDGSQGSGAGSDFSGSGGSSNSGGGTSEAASGSGMGPDGATP